MRVSTARYDRATITLHWIIAAAIVVQWLGAHAIDWFPKGPPRVDARSAHTLVGILLTIALGCRVAWRGTHGVRFREERTTIWDSAASCVYFALYLLLATVLLLGMLNSWVRGDDIFGWFHVPAFGDLDPANRHSLSNQIVGLHRLASNALLILAAVHAAGGLFHYFVLRDGILQRMFPW